MENDNEKTQTLWNDYDRLREEIYDETRKYAESINEIIKKQSIILDRILQSKGYLKNVKEDQEINATEKEAEELCKIFESDRGLHHEVKYHIFDNFDISKLIKLKGLNAFTSTDEFFYKWVEAQYRTGRFVNLYDMLSKGLYHKPENVFMFEHDENMIGNTIIFLPKVPFDKMDRNVSAVKLKIENKNTISIHWYDDSYKPITYIKYLGDCMMIIHTRIFHDYPYLKNCDVYFYINNPDEDEIIDKLKEVIHI